MTFQQAQHATNTVAKCAAALNSPLPALEVFSRCVQTMAQDCRKIFVVPSFVIILLGEIIMAIGGSGAGYQIMYFEVR